jgi:cyanophycin synthetase
MPASLRLAVIAGVGDRRPEDIIAVGATAAQYFDELIIRQDADLRDRTAEEIESLLYLGIHQVAPHKKVTIIRDESEAVEAVLDYGASEMVAVIFADNIQGVLQQMKDAEIARRMSDPPHMEVA